MLCPTVETSSALTMHIVILKHLNFGTNRLHERIVRALVKPNNKFNVGSL
jgi:hypothetical protein